ncbi:DNA/RNA non-specific endonuclease [Lentisphaerota bacterium ZTH]|nr:DNA/RNA non-specific endonuclease [Lentisphaerota bacterium]WET06043.1 DNA/RNA non-specific endonuclease [Lentisphaerota bacterium ZTH]
MFKLIITLTIAIGIHNLSSAYVLPRDDFEGQIVEHFAYTLKYCKQWNQAYWVAYEITAEKLKSPVCKRRDFFRPDPMVKGGSAELADYRESGFDRGHMAPAAIFRWSKNAMNECFYLSNMSPQHKDCNQKIWNKIEQHVRDLALQHGLVNVITGPVVMGAVFQQIGPNRVAVPQLYFKVVMDKNLNPIECFVVPNRGTPYPSTYFQVPIHFVTALTDLQFPSELTIQN